MAVRRPPRPSWQDLTGVHYPHLGYMRDGFDPRLHHYLQTLHEASGKAEESELPESHERLLWVLCAGVWWLTVDQAKRLAAGMARELGPPTSSPPSAAGGSPFVLTAGGR